MKQADTLVGFHGCKLGEISCVGEIALEVLGDNWEYGNAFAYLWRRFGPPTEGCDPHKDLVSYTLTTDRPDVFLWVDPRPSGVQYSFGYMLSEDLTQLVSEEAYARRVAGVGYGEGEKDGEITGPVIKSLTDAMKDLLRPVFIRDVAVTVLGKVSDSGMDEYCWGDRDDYDTDQDWDDVKDLLTFADRSIYAGYGITSDYFSKFEQFKDDKA